MKFTDLLENYIILKEKDRELYYDIKDNIDYYNEFINDILSYNLIIKDEFIKLEKVPAIPESWMGIKSFTDKKEYMFFLLILMYLEDKNKEDQFILSSITEYIEHNYPDEKIEWTVFKNRKSLITVMKVALEIGIIKKNDGDEEQFVKNKENEVLYESTGISKYIVRQFSKDIYEVEDYNELLDESWEGISLDKGIIRKNRVFRSLLLDPIVYNDEESACDYEYIKKYKSHIKNVFEKYLDWDIHIHRNGALAVVKNQNVVKDTFPNMKGEASIALFINKEIVELINEGKLKVNEKDTVIMKESEFDELILNVREKDGDGFTKNYRDASDEYYCKNLKKFMLDYCLIRKDEDSDTIELMPLIGKVIGRYPSDYKGGC